MGWERGCYDWSKEVNSRIVREYVGSDRAAPRRAELGGGFREWMSTRRSSRENRHKSLSDNELPRIGCPGPVPNR
jgi:hypothetical protein